MPTYRVTITRYFTGAESATVYVDAESALVAQDVAERAYLEGDYEGRADVEWEEDADMWDATDHEMEVAEAE